MRQFWIWHLALATLIVGCGDPVLGPADIAGQYQAKAFVIVVNGTTNELLSRGATVNLRLNADLTTSGRITIPIVPGVQVTAVDDDLTGTYTVNNGVVRLTGNSYLDGLAFTADPPELRAFISFSDPNRAGTFNLTLSRQ